MSITTTLEVDTKPMDQAIDKSVNQANKKLSKIGGDGGKDKVLTNMREGIQKGKGGIAEMLDIGNLSGVGMAVSAITIAYQGASMIFEQYKEKLLRVSKAHETNINNIKKDIEATKKLHTEKSLLAQKLSDFSEGGKLDEVQKFEARKAIKDLGVDYKKYGVVLNDVTGSVEGATEAFSLLTKAQKEEEIAKNQKLLQALKNDQLYQQKLISKSELFKNQDVGPFAGKETFDNAVNKSFALEKEIADVTKQIYNLNNTTTSEDILEKAEAVKKKLFEDAKKTIEEKNKDIKDGLTLSKQQIEIDKVLKSLQEKGLKLTEEQRNNIVSLMREQQDLKTDKYFDEQLSALDEQLTLENLKLKGLDEEVEKQKIINDLKKQGLKVDDESIEKILQKKRDLAGIAVASDLKKEFQSLGDEASLKFGNKKQAKLDKTLREYEQKKGSDLTDAEIEKIKKLSELQEKINNTPKLDLGNTDIQSNDLTRRGGASTFAVVPNADRINQQIANYSKMQVDLLREVKNEITKQSNY